MSGVPSPVARFLSLTLAPGYVWVLAVMLARATGKELQTTLIAVVLGSVALMFILFRMSLAEYKSEKTTIEKLMWITSALCIYLAYLGQLNTNSEIVWTFRNLFIGTLLSIAFMLLSTSVALGFLDSSLVLLNRILSLYRRFFSS